MRDIGRAVLVSIVIIILVILAIVTINRTFWDESRPPTTVDISCSADTREPIDLVEDLGLAPELADALENSSLSFRLTLTELGMALALNYSVTDRMAWYVPDNSSRRHLAFRNPNIRMPYHLSFRLIVGSNDTGLSSTVLWGVDNYINVSMTMVDWYTMELEVEPGFEAFGDQVRSLERRYGQVAIFPPTVSNGPRFTIDVTLVASS